MTSETFWLHRLAFQHHVMMQHRGFDGRLTVARPEQILAILGTLGVPISRIDEAPHFVREYRRQKWGQGPPPVVVSRANHRARILWSLPNHCQRVDYILQDETGSVQSGRFFPQSLPTAARWHEGASGYRQCFWLTPPLTMGYHRVQWEYQGHLARTLVIAAPPSSPTIGRPEWGLFLPLYALATRDNWGAGNLGDWAQFAEWTRHQGGSFVGTLPLLPTFLDELYDPSPYRPVSQLFWNEFFLDVERLAANFPAPGSQRIQHSARFQQLLAELRRGRAVDYRRGMRLRREILELLVSQADPVALQSWIHDHPEVHDYARFRAALEHRRTPWQTWPDGSSPQRLAEADCPPDSVQYHQFVQWQADLALIRLTRREQARGGGLYLDLPIGVHPDGFDAWRYQDLFVGDASVGAPPDGFFHGGQNWSVPPLHPVRLREQSYGYFIQTLRHHLRYAKILRLDHVMGFYRRFWIPSTGNAEDGLYVRYPAEEFYAIINLEATRSQTLIVGEDLGLVPKAVSSAIQRQHYLGTWITPVNASTPPSSTLALLGTHDMPPWARFWQTASFEQKQALRKRLGIRHPDPTASRLLPSILGELARSPSRLVMINLEDLYGETSPVNVPGTGEEAGNWCRKMRFDWEQLEQDPIVSGLLREVTRQRQKTGGSR